MIFTIAILAFFQWQSLISNHQLSHKSWIGSQQTLDTIKTNQFSKAIFSALTPSTAIAATAPVDVTELDALIAQGEALFFNETFNGNGRTCGTCHPADNNFTIDPAYISTLPSNDPLFIAETNKDLAEGSGVSGNVIITATATDNVDISKLMFNIDSTEIGQDTVAPYEMHWNTGLFSDGAHQITVTAVDTSANTQSTTLKVMVDNVVALPPPDTTNPNITFDSPVGQSTVSGTVTLAVTASDDIGISKVVFSSGSSELGQATISPFELTWDTTTFPEGSNSITATAIDTSNNSATATISVDVNNNIVCTVYSCPAPPPPPTSPPTSPPPEPVIDPSGNSPDGEFGGELIAKDSENALLTINVDGKNVTVTITSETQFIGSVTSDLSEILIGHMVQGEFFVSSNEVVWIEADMPPGL